MSAAPLLTVSGLSAGYGAVSVLRDVDVVVGEGKMVAVIGPNGAGKSTLLKALYGFARTTAGKVSLRTESGSVDVTGAAAHRLTELGLNFVPQLSNVFATMTVRENLMIGGTLLGKEVGSRVDAVLEMFPILGERVRTRAGTLSGGQRQTLALARAMMTEPSMLLLDEPSAGLSPQAVDDMFRHLDRIRSDGVSILLVEQNARRALAAADYAYVLEAGGNRHQGTGAELLRDEQIAAIYLGGRSSNAGARTAMSSSFPPREAP
jgi:branched-chain amino acid transport system ATP-binding protein